MRFAFHIPDSFQPLTDWQLYELCIANKELRIEREPNGQLTIMSPAGGRSSNRNVKLSTKVENWNESHELGEVFDSSSGFRLPSGAMRGPDVAWISNERWNALSEEEQEEFPPLCPDFVIELRSKTDALRPLKEKMEEWIANGCRLAWLIDPYNQTAYIYRMDGSMEMVDSFHQSLSGEEVLLGFELPLHWMIK